MPILPDQLTAIEDVVNRLAAEAVLATTGRDEGLIPSYSLLGELKEQCALEAKLRDASALVLAELEKRLDAGQPFDEPSLAVLRRLVEWFPSALRSAGEGREYEDFAVRAEVPPPEPATTEQQAAEADRELLLRFELGENKELLGEFHAEAVDHLQQIEAALLALEQEPDEPEALNAIFRSFHTIKGNAGFLGLVPMQKLAHEVESLLDLARNRQLRLTSAIITEILKSRDSIQLLVQQVATALETDRMPTEIIPVTHLIRSVKHFAENAGETLVCELPPRKQAEVIEMPVGDSAPQVHAEEAAAPAAEEKFTAVAVPGSGTPQPAAATTAKAASGNTVRVQTEKLDSLMDVVGELVIVQSQLIESARKYNQEAPILQRNITQLGRIAKELQHTAMSLRMIPIKPTFQKMERLSRDLARSCGKQAVFETEGEDTELDRTMVEEIADPLVHMVRNALDHGMEPPEERKAKGKDETGIVRLRAYHQGSNIVIELSDDGRGIDPARVLAKAQKQGLIPENAALSREETLNLIFLPGFSTAEKVTSVSGRGVGMDVVKRNIDKLRGKIEISSELGKGSVFKIKLPLTMAIIDGLVVRVGEDRFILPSTSVQMALRPARDSIVRVQGTGELLDLRGRMLPLHRLHRRFNIASNAQEPWEGIVVVVEASGKACALMIDEMVSKQEVVIKSLGAFMSGLPGVSGGAILGDGNIALILDPGTLLAAA